MGELGDRDDEDKVEKELEPRRMALADLVRRSQPRRHEPTLATVPLRRPDDRVPWFRRLPDASSHCRSG